VITTPLIRLDRGPARARLWEKAKRLWPCLILLDPLARLHGIDENHAGEVAELLAYFRSLQRELELSVLLVHHTRKNSAGGAAAGQGLRGSSDIHAFGDSNLYLRRTKERLVLSSEHRAAPASAPVHLELVAADAGTIHLEVIAELRAANGKRRSLEEQVIDLLADGVMLMRVEAPRVPGGQERALRRGAGVAGASRPALPHGRWLATSGLISATSLPGALGDPRMDDGLGGG